MKNFIAAALFALTLTACGDGLNPAPNGEECSGNSDCASDDCRESLLSPLTDAYPLEGGMCTESCDFVEETIEGTCGLNELCLQWAQGDRVCFQGCNPEDECERVDEGYECEYITTSLNGDHFACIPAQDSARIFQDAGVGIMEFAPVLIME